MKHRVTHSSPKIITKTDYEYFRNCAQEGLLGARIKKGRYDEAKKIHENLIIESMERKTKLQEIDMKKIQDKSKKLSKLDEEAQVQAMHVLERANKLKIEQEEEILLCNKMILESKCRAIRDLQIAEKKLIQEELDEEEKRLDGIMENREKDIMEREKREAAKSADNKRAFARLLKEQIIKNEEQRIIEFERKQEEARLTNLDNIAWHEEEIRKANRIKEQHALTRKQMLLENERVIKAKEIEREENKILDMRIRKFLNEREERDKSIAEARRLLKAQKDAEIARIATKTQQTYNFQAQIDELNIVRVREEVEREWRNREKLAALKKLEECRKFTQAREEQIKCRRELQAMEMERDKREFNRILEIQKQAIEKEEKIRQKQRQKASEHRIEILKQVNEKAHEKIEEKKRNSEEGLAINKQIQMRANKLKDAIIKKCDEMRENRVPEVYINNVKMLVHKIK